MNAARQALANLRDRIGFDLLRRSGLLTSDQLAVLAREPLPAGVGLTESLVQRRVLSDKDREGFEQHIDARLGGALNHCLGEACQRAGVPPQPLEQLQKALPPERYEAVYQATLGNLIQQLG
jgi:hypothetical protein